MKRNFIYAWLPASLIFFSLATHAETIRLICAFTYSVEADGKSSPTSGESLFTVNYGADGKATIKRQGLGAEFTGTVSEEEITGETHYKLQETMIDQVLTINRFTGELSLTFSANGRGELVHYGRCKVATHQLF